MISLKKVYICRYFSEIDRFCISHDKKSNTLDYIKKSKFYSSLEYYRYIPGPNLTMSQINKYLLNYPYECCFEITKSCNLKCPICISNATETEKHRLSISKFRSIIEKNNFSRVTITGGEPTLHPDLFDMIRISSKKASNIIFSTNGILLKTIGKVFMNFSNVTLAISLHGPKEIHDKFVGFIGAYNRVIKCIQIAMANKIPIHVYSTITREILNSLEELCEILTAFNIKEHRLNLIKPKGRIQSELASYKDVVIKIRKLNLPYKITIKRRDQPFLFIDVNGKEEIRNVRRY